MSYGMRAVGAISTFSGTGLLVAAIMKKRSIVTESGESVVNLDLMATQIMMMIGAGTLILIGILFILAAIITDMTERLSYLPESGKGTQSKLNPAARKQLEDGGF